MLFDKKTMKLVRDYKKVQQYLMEGVPVYMVQLDGCIEEITADTDWKVIFFHNLRQGDFAVSRKRFTIGSFCKDINIGKWCFSVSHLEEGGDV